MILPQAMTIPCALPLRAAMLTVDDEGFWKGLTPVDFGELPRLQDQVTVIGCARSLFTPLP